MAYFLANHGLLICRILCLVLVTATVEHAQNTAPAVKTPEVDKKSTAPPALDFQAQPLTEKLRIGEKNPIFLTITNKSALKIGNIQVSSGEDIFILENSNVPSELGPFQNTTGRVILKTTANTSFEKYKLPIILSYTYIPESAGSESNSQPAKANSRVKKPVATSSPVAGKTSALVSIDVARNFDEEAKGFPGGTAAFLYLLLPIIPAMLTFRLANNYRKGLGIQMPTFKSEDIVPAFLFAVVFSFITLFAFDQDIRLRLSDPLFFLLVLSGSAVAGVLFPLGHYFYGLLQMKKWGFKENDSYGEYLRKALLSEYSPGQFSWASGTIGKDSFEGILLNQPTGKIVFGMTLQVSPKGGNADYLQKLENQVFKDEALANKSLLLDMIDSGEAVLQKLEDAEQNGAIAGGTVIIPPNGETLLTSNPKKIVVLTS